MDAVLFTSKFRMYSLHNMVQFFTLKQLRMPPSIQEIKSHSMTKTLYKVNNRSLELRVNTPLFSNDSSFWCSCYPRLENSAVNLCQKTPILFVCWTFPITRCFRTELQLNTILYGRAGEKRQHFSWKGMWPLAPLQRPRSEQSATVVITEGLIADRTFQQPVVNCLELRGRKHQKLDPDTCYDDDLYFEGTDVGLCIQKLP